MQAYWTLIRRELGSHFCSWTGYIVIACVVFLLGCSFNNLIVALNPDSPGDRLSRARANMQRGDGEAAKADLRWLLDQEPAGIDLERLQEIYRSL